MRHPDEVKDEHHLVVRLGRHQSQQAAQHRCPTGQLRCPYGYAQRSVRPGKAAAGVAARCPAPRPSRGSGPVVLVEAVGVVDLLYHFSYKVTLKTVHLIY